MLFQECGISLDYLAWNEKLATHFFRPEQAGRPVYLFITEDVMNEICKQEGTTFADFVAALHTGPPGTIRQGLCIKAFQAYEGWRGRNHKWPPYIAYLAAFVAAAGVEGDFAPNAYYSRLRALINEPGEGTLPSFGKMHTLWEDLEIWSTVDKNGELGIFHVRSVGGWAHVGLPKAQTLLTHEELGLLSTIFWETELDPTAPPSDAALAQVLIQYGSAKLRKRTITTLIGGSEVDTNVRAALLQILFDELAEWNGEVLVEGSTSEKIRAFGHLRLCATIDRTAATAFFSIRCATNKSLPNEELVLIHSGSQTTLCCEEEVSGLSTPLVHEKECTLFDASILDWSGGETIEAEGKGWKFRLPAATIKVLVSGATLGLSGYIETKQLPRNCPFILLTLSSQVPVLNNWLRNQCIGARELALSGLPSKWKLFSIDCANDDKGVAEQFPVLSFQRIAQLRTIGGIHADSSNSFFRFAPPAIVFDGSEGNEQLKCNGQPIELNPITPVFILPTITEDTRLRIEVWRGEKVVAVRTIFLIEPIGTATRKPTFYFDPRSLPIPFDSERYPRAIGAQVLPSGKDPLEETYVLPLYEIGRIYFIGRETEQICCWPLDATPTEWKPIWAIPMRRTGRAIYCGSTPDAEAPIVTVVSNHRKRKLWKTVLWHDRKRILEPSQKQLRALWRQYREAAQYIR